jgi:large subunit ribosomal protein L16
MLQPKRTKFRKVQKGKNRGLAWTGSDVSFGDFALQAVDRAFLTARQIEACRMAIQRHVKRQGKLWIRIFPDKPLTKKPLEVRRRSPAGDPPAPASCWWAGGRVSSTPACDQPMPLS